MNLMAMVPEQDCLKSYVHMVSSLIMVSSMITVGQQNPAYQKGAPFWLRAYFMPIGLIHNSKRRLSGHNVDILLLLRLFLQAHFSLLSL